LPSQGCASPGDQEVVVGRRTKVIASMTWMLCTRRLSRASPLAREARTRIADRAVGPLATEDT
jgi:hypothetical protein